MPKDPKKKLKFPDGKNKKNTISPASWEEQSKATESPPKESEC